MDSAASITARDAVELAHALASEVAEVSGIRALLIKGLVTSHHGLRPARVSADADVWVEPSGADLYVASMSEVGWRAREVSSATSELVSHSVTLIHPDWPCDLDVHRSFPGFLDEEDTVFDALWARRRRLTIAMRPVWVADYASSFLITALHAMRTPSQTPRHGVELRRLVDEVLPGLDESKRRDVLALAIATASVDTARPVLEHLGIDLPERTPGGANAALDAWRTRTGAGSAISVIQWQRIAKAPMAAWPRLLWRALWPSERDFRLDHHEVAPGRAALNRGRRARLGRGLRDLPGAIHGRRLARKGITDDSLLHDPGEQK